MSDHAANPDAHVSSYEEQMQALIDEINAWAGEGGFQEFWDTSWASSEEMFGDTGKTAGEWGEMAGDIDYGQSFEDWAAENGYSLLDISGETGGMQDLIDQLANPDTEEGFSHSARMLGFASDEEAQEALTAFRVAMEGGSEGQAGMSPEDMALRQRMNQTNMRDMEARSKRLVQNSFANSGSTVQMLAAADEASRGLSLTQLQQDEALAREQFERQTTQWNEQASMYSRMVETRQMSYSQFMATKTASISAAIEGYSSKINAMQTEYSQHLQQHQGDMAILEANANRLFAMSNLQLGMTEATFNMTQSLYDAKVKTFTDRINLLLAAEGIEDDPDAFATLMQLLTVVGTLVILL